MSLPVTIDEAILRNALGPDLVTVGSQTVKQHPLKDQIEAANFLASQNAAALPHFGLRFTRLIPGPRD